MKEVWRVIEVCIGCRSGISVGFQETKMVAAGVV